MSGISSNSTLTNARRRPWIFISAYDLSMGESSEGHVAFNIIRRLCASYRIVLLTRRNNKAQLEASTSFFSACPCVHLVGYDLPMWARWWKRGARFYQAYAYLWQMTWPLAIRRRTRLRQSLHLVHVLNFHNDSIPSLAWRLDRPVIWGPINHNEVVPQWRRTFWPVSNSLRHLASFLVRRALWAFDPFLKAHARHCNVIISAGEWVDRRLDLGRLSNVMRRSQLGVDDATFHPPTIAPQHALQGKTLICAGRLDWIKGIDLAIEALPLLPADFRLKIVGAGPAEARLRALAEDLGVTSRVTFLAPVPRDVLPALYAQADLFLFTSAEVAGLAWIEALSCGLPVVAFDGATEVAAAARKLPGIFLAADGKHRKGQIENLASAIRAAAAMPRESGKLSDAALKHYGWDQLTTTIDEAYRAAMESAR